MAQSVFLRKKYTLSSFVFYHQFFSTLMILSRLSIPQAFSLPRSDMVARKQRGMCGCQVMDG